MTRLVLIVIMKGKNSGLSPTDTKRGEELLCPARVFRK
jgi:hypothetical protein